MPALISSSIFNPALRAALRVMPVLCSPPLLVLQLDSPTSLSGFARLIRTMALLLIAG